MKYNVKAAFGSCWEYESLRQKHEWRSLVNYLFVATSYSIVVYAKLVEIVMIQLLGLMEDNCVQQPSDMQQVDKHAPCLPWVPCQ
jgi:hypothetical protein